MSDSVVLFPQETTKERNRRLRIQDRSIQARVDKTRRSRRASKSSKQVEMLRSIKEKKVPVKIDRCKSGGGGVRDDVSAGMDDSTSYARWREVETILRRKFRLAGGTRRTRRRFRT